jgi:hypothetical protein
VTRRRPAVPRLLAGLLLLLSLAVVTGPAQARDAGLQVSRSESGPYADQLSGPLLSGIGRVVPLDTAGGTFFVRNASPRVARTTVAVVNRGDRDALTGALSLSVDVGGTTVTGTLPPDGERCDLVVTGPDLEPGAVQPVAVDLEVGDLHGQRGTDEQLALDVDVTLTQLGGSDGVAACGEQASAGPSPAADCERTAVVTLAGDDRCPPTAVDAGLEEGPWLSREPATVAGSILTLVVVGGMLLLGAQRRRRLRGRHCA